MIIAICVAVLSLIAGGYGLGLVCYERGYVHGYEDATQGWVFTPEGPRGE